MGAGTKILAGCGCLAIAVAVAAVAVVGFGAYWIKDKATDVAGGLEAITSTTNEIDEWERQANANPYEKPANGVIPESRLLAFLDVRRQVHDVYRGYELDIQALERSAEDGNVTESATELFRLGQKTVRMFNDLRLAQVKGLAGAGMSEEEYYAIQTAVYMAAGASEADEKTGTLPAEAMAETARQTREAMKAGLEAAREKGVPGSDQISDEELKRLEDALAKMEVEGSQALSVPEANLKLFKKHEDAIRKYAMHGLAFVGL